MTSNDVLAFRCATCWAPVGQPCVKPDGTVIDGAHNSRVRLLLWDNTPGGHRRRKDAA